MQKIQPLRFGQLIVDSKTITPEWLEAIQNTQQMLPRMNNAINDLGYAGIDIFVTFEKNENGAVTALLRIQDQKGRSLMGEGHPPKGLAHTPWTPNTTPKEYAEAAQTLFIQAFAFGISELASCLRRKGIKSVVPDAA